MNFCCINKVTTKVNFVLVILFLFSCFHIFACASPFYKKWEGQISQNLTLDKVLKNPATYVGKKVVWSGVIIKSVNLKEGTLLEILEKPSDSSGKPKDVDESQGRFMALKHGYLDVAIYSPGRKITIFGEIRGKRTQTLGEIEYTYPLLLIEEAHLWKPEKEVEYYPCPYPYWYNRWCPPYWYYYWW